MKTQPLIFLVLFNIIFFCQPSLGEDSSLKYERVAHLVINNPKTNTPYKAEIPIDLLEGTLQTDLRIYDKNNKEVPFLVELANTDEKREDKSLKIYNQSFINAKEQTLELDLRGSNVDTINELELQLEDLNFDRSVTIYGRDSKEDDWKQIKGNLKIIANFLPEQKIDFKHTSLKFPEVRYRFIKLQIQLKQGQKPLKIVSVKSQLLISSPLNQFHSVKLPFKELKLNKQNKKSSYWELDSKDKEYFFETIKLDFSEDAFSREATLYCSNKANPKYIDDPEITYITSSTLYKFKDIQNLQISPSEKNCKYYILEVFQGDNLPVQLNSAEGKSRKMYLKFILETPFELPLQIYSKSISKDAPFYDLQARIQQEKIQDFEKAEIQEISINPKYKKLNKVEENKFKTWFPYAGAVILILLVLTYIISLAKKIGHDS